MTIQQPHSNTIVLEFDELPTEAAVLARLAQEVNAVPGDVVNIRVAGLDVTSAAVIAGEGGAAALRLTDALAEG
ncbi:MAG: hypothetical protein ABIS47_11000 [Acidimicrobiales bacterium]